MLAAPTQGDLEELGSTVLRRYAQLTLTTAGAIRRAGLELRPTFRRPHYTVMLPNLVTDIDRLVRCDNEVRRNAHFEGEEAP